MCLSRLQTFPPINVNFPTVQFQLSLTSKVSPEDFHLGYCLTGVLEKGPQKYSTYKVTHLAFVRRKEGTLKCQKAQRRRPPKLSRFWKRNARIPRLSCQTTTTCCNVVTRECCNASKGKIGRVIKSLDERDAEVTEVTSPSLSLKTPGRLRLWLREKLRVFW